MNDNQFNTLNMAKTAMGVMDENHGIWTGKIKIEARVTNIKGLIIQVETLEGIQSDSGKGATISEHIAWEKAAGISEHVCFGLKAYYDDIDDQTQFGMVNFTMSDFLYGQRNDVLDKMKKVYSHALLVDADTIKDFNVLAADLVDMDNAIKDFDNSIPVRNVIRSGTAAATKELPDVFTALRKQFKSLDLLIGSLKATQGAFFDAYTKARVIIDLGKSQLAEELHLVPTEYKAVFGNKFKIGHWFTVRNHGDFPIIAYLTDTPDTLVVKNEVVIEGQNEVKLEVPIDFKNEFAHWLMVYNERTLDDAHVTIILAHGKSQSKANILASKVKPG
jgi:hypothetical protein